MSLCVIIAGLYTPGKPSSPRIVSIANQSVTLEWTSPENDGGYRISVYYVIYGSPAEHRAVHFNQVVKGPTTTTTVIENLSLGRTYQFAVAARNKAGLGQFSDLSSCLAFPGEAGEYILALWFMLSLCGNLCCLRM